MQDKRTINEWLTYQGLRWREGEERFYKASFTWLEAQELIERLEAEGALEYNG